MYWYVKWKFNISLFLATAWLGISIWLSLPWLSDLANVLSYPVAVVVIAAIAWIPGFMNAFLLSAFISDKRPNVKEITSYPPITILIAAYNEENYIADTIHSLSAQNYPGEMQIIVIDDGSIDKTMEILKNMNKKGLLALNGLHQGKAGALNLGLSQAAHDLIITLDADTYLLPNSLKNIVARILSDPPNTAAVAGSVYAKNSRINLMTKMQSWDYFQAIAAIKRMQSLFQGTLVAQGAFSIYYKKVLEEVGGWKNCVGEDIVLTWAMLQKGYRTGFAETAISFTNVPTNYKTFFAQRSRWARGMLEAFRQHFGILKTKKFFTLLIYWNLMFPLIDMMFFFVFLPGVVAAFFGYYLIAGPITLAVLPIAILQNIVFFTRQRNVFHQFNLKVRKDKLGFICYVLFYQILMVPACLHGYWNELFKREKKWLSK